MSGLPSSTAPKQWSHALSTLFGVALVTALLYWARPVLIPVALAILFTFLLAPLATRLNRMHLGRVFSAVLATLLALSLAIGAGWLLARQLGGLVESYPRYERNINAKIASLRGLGHDGTLEQARKVAQKVQRQLERADVEDTPEETEVRRAQAVRVVVDPGPFRLNEFWSVAEPFAAPLASAALVVVLVFFMLLGRADLRDRFIALMGERQLAQTTTALNDAGKRIGRFLRTQLAINAGFGVTVAIGLYLLGIPFAPLWGALALVLRYIPYLGAWLAMLLPLAMSLLVSPDWGTSLSVIALFAVVEAITNLLLEPYLYGRGIGVSQTALLIAVAFWAWLWGPVGLVLASPLTVCLVVLGRHVPSLRFFETLLADEPALEPRHRFYQRLLARDDDGAAEIADTLSQERSLVEVFDQLLVPALGAVREDMRLQRVDDEGVVFVAQSVSDIAVHLARQSPGPYEAEGGEGEAGEGKPGESKSEEGIADTQLRDSTPVKILGVPLRDGVDEAGLLMFAQLARRQGMEWVQSERSQGADEIVKLVAQEKPDVICVASIPPGGLSHTRYLIDRLRERYPEVRLVVGRWGASTLIGREQEMLGQVGAQRIAVSLFDTLNFCRRRQGNEKTVELATAPA